MANFKLATCGEVIKIWDVNLPNAVLHRQYSPHTNSIVNDISWSYDGQFLASASVNGDKVVLAYMDTDSFSTAELPMSAEQQCIQFSNVTARYLLTGGKNGQVNVWDLKSRKIKKVLAGHSTAITRVRFNVNDTYILSGSEKGDIILHNMVTGLGSSPLRTPKVQAIRDLKYSPFRRALFGSASEDGSVALWDANSRKLNFHFKGSHQAPAMGLAFSLVNDSFLVSVGLDKKIVLYDISVRRVVRSISNEQPLTAVDFHQDGATLVVGTTRGMVAKYDLRQSPISCISSISAHKTAVQCLAIQTVKPSKMRPESASTRIVSRSASSSPKRFPFSSATSSSTATSTSESHSVSSKKDIAVNGSLKASHNPVSSDTTGSGDRTSSENRTLNRSSVSNLSDEVFSPLRTELSPEPTIRKQPIGAGSSNPLDVLGDRPATTGLAESDGVANKKLPDGITMRKSGPSPMAKRRSSSSSPRAMRNLSKDKRTNEFFSPLAQMMDAGLPPLPFPSSQSVTNGISEENTHAMKSRSVDKLTSTTKPVQGDETENIVSPPVQPVSAGSSSEAAAKSTTSTVFSHQSPPELPTELTPFVLANNASSYSLNGIPASLSSSSTSSVTMPTTSSTSVPAEITVGNNLDTDNTAGASMSTSGTVHMVNDRDSTSDLVFQTVEEASEHFRDIAHHYFVAFQNSMIREFQIQKAEIKEIIRDEFSKCYAKIKSLEEENKRLRAKF